MSMILHLCETHNAFSAACVIPAVLPLVFCKLCLELRNCKSVFLILNISHYGGSRQWVQLFPMHLCKNWYKNWYLYSIRPMATKFGKQVDLEELTQMNLFKQLLVTSSTQDHLTNSKHYISTISVTMATKLGRMYLDRLLPTKSRDAYKVMRDQVAEKKPIIFLLPWCE